MLQLAETEGKPVSIHSRKALDDILEMLPSFRVKKVLLHWFAGSRKQLSRASEMGLYVSFGPALVYSEDKQVLLRNAPRERILVETDGPVPFSRCFESLPASPTSFLVSVVASAAKILGLEYRATVALLESNSLSYLS
jgi:TatD DNase family protein